MHELTLAYRTIETIEQYAIKENASRVTQLWLELGAFSCVEAESMQFCFDVVCQGTLAENCQLHLITSEPTAWCKKCEQTVRIETQRIYLCPLCGSNQLQLNSSTDIRIKRIEVI